MDTPEVCEVWLPVVGFPDYEVSSLGGVRSLARTVTEHNGKVRFHKTKPMKASPSTTDGYPIVPLRRDGKTTHRYVHVLVMQAFMGPAPAGQEVRHRDGNRANARLDNLHYGTRAQNIDDAKQHGTFPHAGNFRRGERHPNAKLTREIVRLIYLSDEPATTIAAVYGVSKSVVSHIWRGLSWASDTSDLTPPARSVSGDEWYRRRGLTHRKPPPSSLSVP